MIDPGLIVTVVVVLVVATAAIFPGFCGYVASTKGRSIKAWVLLGIFFGPIVLLATSPRSGPRRRRRTGWKTCGTNPATMYPA